MDRKNEIIHRSLGIDYSVFTNGSLAFDYEKVMNQHGYPLEDIIAIQNQFSVGNTPLIELGNLTQLIRKMAPKGKGATIVMKDEAVNPSGSFKDRRACLAVHEAQKKEFPGVLAATSGNYGAAVASQAAKRGLPCIVVQETFDSQGLGQPEILEKGRKCEELGAEVVQLSVGPELFYTALMLLEETGFFNASLYSPYAITGIETLGYEIGSEVQQRYGRAPSAVLVTHAGGGNLTGTARGLEKSGCEQTEVVGVSVDLSGLHMASDQDFNRKSFTTGHTGFSVPFTMNPDRTDVPHSSARPLRYMSRFVTVTQGEVFYATELLAKLEGLERGPAGNTSLVAALVLAKELDVDEVVVVQESEYTGAGKHPISQLNFAKEQGITVKRGHPGEQKPGQSIVIPDHIDQLSIKDVDLERLRQSYLKTRLKGVHMSELTNKDRQFLAEEIGREESYIQTFLDRLSQ